MPEAENTIDDSQKSGQLREARNGARKGEDADKKNSLAKRGATFARKMAANQALSSIFIYLLVICVTKDILDAVTLGVVGTIVNIAVTFLLVIIKYLYPDLEKNRKLFGKWDIITIIIEFIPFINIVPTYTIRVIVLKLEVSAIGQVIGSGSSVVKEYV